MPYSVKAGETLTSIAQQHGLTLDELLAANPSFRPNPNLVRVNDNITLPSRTERLGQLSEKYETGGRGPGTVSNGVGDPGGVSYGSYQMTSNKGGTVARFVSGKTFPWRKAFKNLKPGSVKFSAKWREVAEQQPEAFFEAQHLYIQKTHFDPLVERLDRELHLGCLQRPRVVQDVIWSTAVQHGPETSVIHNACDTLKQSGQFKPTLLEFDRLFIKAVYAERGKKNKKGQPSYFLNSSAEVQQGVLNRFVKEERDALTALQPRLLPEVTLIGELSAKEKAATLRAMGEKTPKLKSRSSKPQKAVQLEGFFSWGPRVFEHTSHQFGYIPHLASNKIEPQNIQYPGTIQSKSSLKNQRIDIRLDRLRVHDYPGNGEHLILFTFKIQRAQEPISFSQTYRVREGQSAGIAGYPIFIGLSVGKVGLGIHCSTINVKNKDDEKLLGFLESSTFRSGLDLLTTAQPALKPLTEMALGLATTIGKRNRNIGVQDFYLGLDFSKAALGMRLAEGSYIAVQTPTETTIDWKLWKFYPNTGAIASTDDQTQLLPYNYVIFRVDKHNE